MRADLASGIELASEHVEAIGGETARRHAAIFLHGILGSGTNLRAVAKRFVGECPGWHAHLLDLRGHGRSPKGTRDPSIEAAARDVELFDSWARPDLIVGHSFGGKVALEMVQLGIDRHMTRDESSLVPFGHVMTLDSNPGAREPLVGGDSALGVLDTIDALPETFPTKAAFIRSVGERHGHALAQWLAMSTEPTSLGGVRFALDRGEMRALLHDYFARDLWSVVEAPPEGVHLHLVIADRSISYSPDDRARAAAIAAREPRVTVDVLPADHWVHVDDPDGVQRVLVERVGGAS